ncbi:YlbF family regulator [Fictibacillus sp. Mic-4]|uniref:YlbF family regulator n=1 Tax=Fictibacillus TaxID=1329200 RepID=UPI00041D3F63|nr:YlbF family regulator [Fictibacillus gelatini]
MIGTITNTELLDESYLLGKMIAESELAARYRMCKFELEQDKRAQKLIRQFTDMKERYEEVQRFGKYHPDYKQVSTDIRVLKRELDFHETIANFKKAEKELETLLIECSMLIAGSVSKHIKVPTGNPFFDSRSCSGGCGSGGSCGCQ